MKKTAGPLVGVVIAILAVVCFLLLAPVNIFKAVPSTAVAIIETSDWNKINQTTALNAASKTFLKTVAVKKLTDEIEVMMQLVNSNKIMQAKIISPKLIVSLHLTTADDFDYLFTTPISGVDDNSFLNVVKSSKNVRTINIRIFHKQKVIDIGLVDGSQLTFADLKGIFAFSFTSFLTESSITGIISGNNVENDKAFKIIRKKFVSSGDLSVFFNFKSSDIILPVFLQQQFIPLLSDVSAFADWGAYNISQSTDALKIEGIAHNSSKKIETHQISPAQDTVMANIPDNIAYLDLSSYEGEPGKYFKDWAGSTHAFVILEPLKEDFSGDNLFIISSNDKAKALSCLKQLNAGTGNQIPVDTFNTMGIYKLESGALINRLYGGSLTRLKSSFFAVADQVVVFGNTIDAVKFTLGKISRGETLKQMDNFKNMSQAASSFIYFNPQRAGLMLGGLLQESSALPNFLEHYKPILIQTNYRDGWLNTTATLKSNGENKAPGGLLWKTSLKAPAAISPQIVINSTTRENEIFVQDTLGNIYLLDKSGEILFTVHIDGQIMGMVQQLDYYNNGKLQYIFNTSNQIYIVDRLGNFVASYPLKLSYPATAGLTLIRDSATGVNRFFVPSVNGSIYGYESTGKPLAGWSPRSGVGLMSKPLESIWDSNTLHIVATTEGGKLRLLNHRGGFQWSVNNLPNANQNFTIIQQKDGFLLLNAVGRQLITISADGNDNQTPLIDSARFFTATATSDTSYLYFFANHSQVRSYNNRNEFQRSLGLKNANISTISMLSVSTSKYLLIQDMASNNALVYDLELNPIAEFRIDSRGLFVITDLLGKGELIGLQAETGSAISCYRLR